MAAVSWAWCNGWYPMVTKLCKCKLGALSQVKFFTIATLSLNFNLMVIQTRNSSKTCFTFFTSTYLLSHNKLLHDHLCWFDGIAQYS